MRPSREFLILIEKSSLYYGEGRHKDVRNLQRGEVKGAEIEIYIANLLRRIINLQSQNDILTREDLARLGKMLYNFLKEWNLDVAFRRFYREIADDAAAGSNGRIYLEFSEDAGRLAVLPWEYLSYGEKDHFLGADKEFKFDLVRRFAFQAGQGVFTYTPKPPPTQKARILLIASEPVASGLAFGAAQVIAWFKALRDAGMIDLRVISQPVFSQFAGQIDAIVREGFQPDIIHFAGHGEVNEEGGFVGFFDPAQPQEPDWIEDEKFLDFLSPVMSSVKLAFLHACGGGMMGDYASKRGLAQRFLLAKTPALVAMQAPVKPQVVFDFAQVFYAALLEGADVAQSVTAGRQKLCFELQEMPVSGGGRKKTYNKRVNPYGDQSFGIPVLYITTEEPFALLPEEREAPAASSEPAVYFECQNRPNPRCLRIKLVEKDEEGCPVCGGPLVAIRRQGGAAESAPQAPSSARSVSPVRLAGPINTPPEPSKIQSGVQTILFLAANPKDSSRLRLDEEASRIKKALERSKHRDKFRLEPRWAVQIPDLRRALLDEQPGIIHFSGHGSPLGRIYLEDAAGAGQEVSAEALGNLFNIFKEHIRCVILNACFSELQAQEIAKHGIPVIGMSSKVPDQAGVEFSEAFYDALGAGRDLEFAFALGCSAIEMYKLDDKTKPKLIPPP